MSTPMILVTYYLTKKKTLLTKTQISETTLYCNFISSYIEVTFLKQFEKLY